MFTASAVLTLALGIGANTAMFTLADATLLRPLPVRDPERLVVWSWSSSYPDYQEYTKSTDVFDGVAAVAGGGRINLVVDGNSDLTPALFVTGNAFDLLGVSAALGRLILPADDVRNGPLVGVLGYDYWRKRFGGDPSVVGRTLRANGRPVTIVGVAAEGIPRAQSRVQPVALYSRGRLRPGAHRLLLPRRRAHSTGIGLAERRRAPPPRRHDHERGRNDDRRLRQVPSARARRKGRGPPTGAAADAGARPGRGGCPEVRRDAAGGGRADAADRLRQPRQSAAGESRDAAAWNWACAWRSARRGHASCGRCWPKACCSPSRGGTAGIAVAALALRMLSTYQLPGRHGDRESASRARRRRPGGDVRAVAGDRAAVRRRAGVARVANRRARVAARPSPVASTSRSATRSVLLGAQVALSLVLLAGTGLFARSLLSALQSPLGFDRARRGHGVGQPRSGALRRTRGRRSSTQPPSSECARCRRCRSPRGPDGPDARLVGEPGHDRRLLESRRENR